MRGEPRGASESRICAARNPAVCAQIGCYLSAAGDRAHSGLRSHVHLYTLAQSPVPARVLYVHARAHVHTRACISTTYKREMRTLPILASRRSPEASFKLPTTLSLSSYPSSSPLIPPRSSSSPSYPTPSSAVLVVERSSPIREKEREREIDLPQLLRWIVKIDPLSCNSDRRAGRIRASAIKRR